jgi:phospholipase/carboxylesterase
MGSVMSYALGLGRDRPAVAGILAFSGFIPTVSGFEPSLSDRLQTRAFISHGRNDPVIDVSFARGARDLLEREGLEVEYRESDGRHYIEPTDVPAAARWLSSTLAPASRRSSARET